MVARSTLVAVIATAVIGVTAAPGMAGVGGPAFYVDGEPYRTVATPTDFSNTGAPAHSYDTIYEFFGLQLNVATAAPGDREYNGGRWMVHGLEFDDYEAAVEANDANGSGDLDSDEEVLAALLDGSATDIGVIRSFECPAIPFPRGR
jgi:hypothetical protein